jgi:excisionase family DNA binding protein
MRRRNDPVVNDDPVMTAEDCAHYLRVHRTTIYRLLKHHGLPAFKIGSDWRFRKSQVDAWVSKQQGEVPKP